MSAYWDVYFGYIEDKIASIVLDMDIFREIDTDEYSHSFAVKFNVKVPNEDGFPIEEEAEKLYEIEVAFKEYLFTKNFLNVGRITTDGSRDIIFYSNQEDSAVLKEAADLYIQPNGYEFEIFSISEDENWEFYFEYLYPNQYQQQHMGNRDVVDSLVESGDKLKVPRNVEHWLFFENTKMMKRFIKSIKKEGFSIVEESNKIDEEGKYSLSISRIDSVDYDAINDVTNLLIEIAEKYEGDYDGWETFVIQE